MCSSRGTETSLGKPKSHQLLASPSVTKRSQLIEIRTLFIFYVAAAIHLSFACVYLCEGAVIFPGILVQLLVDVIHCSERFSDRAAFVINVVGNVFCCVFFFGPGNWRPSKIPMFPVSL